MKKIFVVSVLMMLAIVLSSCGMTDSRLNGDWYLSEIHSKITNTFWKPDRSEEISFSRYFLKEISKYQDGKEHNLRFRYEIIHKEDDGGSFYSSIPGDSKKDLYAYIFEDNKLILYRDDPTGLYYVYLRK